MLRHMDIFLSLSPLNVCIVFYGFFPPLSRHYGNFSIRLDLFWGSCTCMGTPLRDLGRGVEAFSCMQAIAQLRSLLARVPQKSFAFVGPSSCDSWFPQHVGRDVVC